MDEEIFLRVKRDVMREDAKKSTSTENMSALKAYISSLDDRLLTEEEEKAFIRLIKSGHEEARELFIRLNLRLVVNVAKRYANYGLDFIDLIEEGNIGLMLAIQKFDPDKGNKLSTYAVEWILQNIKRSLSKSSRTIRISDSMYWKRWRYNMIMSECESDGKEPPSPEELARMLNISLETLKIISGNTNESVNYSSFLKEGTKEELLDVITARNDDSIEDLVAKKMLEIEVRRLMDKVNLSPKEKEVVCLIFGIGNRKVHTQADVARLFNVSREWISHVYNRSIDKFIKYQSMEDYAIYMDRPTQAIEYINERRKKL